MLKSIIVITILSFLNVSSCSAIFEDSFYLHLYKFQVEKGVLKDGDISSEQLQEKFFIKELVKGTNTEDIQIYKFYNLVFEDVDSDIVIIRNGTIEIYDSRNINFLIKTIIEIPQEETDNLENGKKIQWIKALLEIDEENREQELDNIVFQKQFGKYSYFLSND